MKTKTRKIAWILPVITAFVILVLLLIPKIILLNPESAEQNKVKFSWLGINGYASYRILIDDNRELSSPFEADTLETSYLAELGPGEYCWKIVGYINGNKEESEVSCFEITPAIVIERTEDGVRNSGNVAVLLNRILGGGVTGHSVVEIGDNEEISKEIDELEASQK